MLGGGGWWWVEDYYLFFGIKIAMSVFMQKIPKSCHKLNKIKQVFCFC